MKPPSAHIIAASACTSFTSCYIALPLLFQLQVMTTAKSRTWRISVYEAALTLGLVAGSSTSGLIIDHIGVAALYGITAGKGVIF